MSKRIKHVKPPKDEDLPFFAYGIFKPNQIAYSKIKKYVKSYYEKEIEFKMLMRDGVPLIVHQKNNNHKTKGYLICFNNSDDSKKAYEIISKNEPEKLYKWEKIQICEMECNVLMGNNPELGSSNLESKIGDYNGLNDPFFKEVIEIIEEEIKNNNNKWHDIHGFFKLQMNYMLLWASIERYCSLKYNAQKIWEKRKQLAGEEIFKESLGKYVQTERKVYSAEDLKEYTLNAKKPEASINYYYTIRCNVTHRGKSLFNDRKMLEQSLEELLNIFKDVLKDTFNNNE